MLVLSRKPQEKVVISGEITITVVAVIGGKVRIGIEAPANVVILRGELVGRSEATSLAAGLGADTAPSLERDSGGQGGAEDGRADLLPAPIIAAAIKDPLSRLRKIPR
jgi:carbon storage regulator